jgi:hypothetical protein
VNKKLENAILSTETSGINKDFSKKLKNVIKMFKKCLKNFSPIRKTYLSRH